MRAVVFLLGGLTVLAWLVAAGSALELVLWHPQPDHGFSWYALNGMAFLDPDNFAPTGASAHQRMMMGFAGFAICAGLTGAASFATQE